ncbi:MAG: TolC family protein [Stenotrophobium sp.]
MSIISRAWLRALLLGGCVVALPADADTMVPLTLGEASQLAAHDQPLLQEQDADAEAARERAEAVRQLPDPQLMLQVMDLPVDTAESFSPNRDSFTIYSTGVMQAFPLPGKRRLRSEREQLSAQMDEATRDALSRRVIRDAGVAWVEVWADQQMQALIAAQVAQAQTQQRAATILYKNGTGNQADVLAAQLEAQMLADKRDETAQKLGVARAELSRWIGDDAAQRPLPQSLPALPDPPPLDALLAALPNHPALLAAGRGVARAGKGVALARENYWPDWSLEVDYGYRPQYADFITLTARVDLPVFRGNRQDRELSAAHHDADAAAARHDDLQRELGAGLRAADSQWRDLGKRLQRYDLGILPQARARVDAALADYRAGNGPLSAVLDVRQADLDAQLRRLQLAADVARLRLTLQYFQVQAPGSVPAQESLP